MSRLRSFRSRKCCLCFIGVVVLCQLVYSYWLLSPNGAINGLSEDHHTSLSSHSVNSRVVKTMPLPTKGTSTTKSPKTPSVKNIVIKPSLRRFDTPIPQKKKQQRNKNMVMPDEFKSPSSSPSVAKGLVRKDRQALDRKNQAAMLNFTKRRNFRTVKNGPASDWEIEIVSKLFYISSQHSGTTPQPQDILRKFQHQSMAMADLCTKYNFSSELPKDNYTQTELYHHLLYDDSKRIIFCYVPKSGCSNWKRMFAVLDGTVQANDTERPSKDILQKVKKLEYLSQEERDKRLKSYFKFVFVRNPLDRIVSGYRNKVDVPINRANINHWPDRTLYQMIKKYDKDTFFKWAMTNFTSSDFRPSFEVFLQYLIDTKLSSVNEHFRPFIELCHPCAIHYNFFGNLNSLPEGAYEILDFLGIPHKFYLNRVEHPSVNTTSLVSKYYDQLAEGLKVSLLRKFIDELLVYYKLFPSDVKNDIDRLRLTRYIRTM